MTAVCNSCRDRASLLVGGFFFRVLLLLLLYGKHQGCNAFTLPLPLSGSTHHHRRQQQQHAKVAVAQRGEKQFSLDYKLVTGPDRVNKTPLVVLHGGPGLPHNYLLPLQDVIVDRPIFFHDQLGCGASDKPKEGGDMSFYYSIENSVQDIVALLKEVNVSSFHLYGQSYGGILAFEYLKKLQHATTTTSICRSVILSSAPSSIALADQEWNRLLSEIPGPWFMKDEAFRQQHVCRTERLPKPLEQAYSLAASSVWGGIDVIADYEASIQKSKEAAVSVKALATRGEFDFVSRENLSKWKDCFREDLLEVVEFEGCSHNALLEQPALYGSVLNDFLHNNDA